MDSTSISSGGTKAIVGVALAAVFGTGIYFYAVRGANPTQVTQAPAAIAAPPAAPSTADPASPSGTADAGNSDGKSDSKISNDVKTQIAAAAPNSNVNVTTTNGVVALNGSVPNQDALNQARVAAQSVHGVKTVDTSGLLVSNNQ